MRERILNTRAQTYIRLQDDKKKEQNYKLSQTRVVVVFIVSFLGGRLYDCPAALLGIQGAVGVAEVVSTAAFCGTCNLIWFLWTHFSSGSPCGFAILIL